MKKLAYKSDAQVKSHIARFGKKTAESPAHEAKESAGFEKAEHRLYKKENRMGRR